MNEQDVFEKLAPLVREVTGAREDQVTMDSGLMEDLGAESIDLLDMSFLVEETFGIMIEADEFERQAGGSMDGQPYEKDGCLTDRAIEELRKALPEVPPDKFKPGMKQNEVPGVLNVVVFVYLIQRKLVENKRGESC